MGACWSPEELACRACPGPEPSPAEPPVGQPNPTSPQTCPLDQRVQQEIHPDGCEPGVESGLLRSMTGAVAD